MSEREYEKEIAGEGSEGGMICAIRSEEMGETREVMGETHSQ